MGSDTSATAAIAAVWQEHLDAVNTTDLEFFLKGLTDDVVYIATGAAPILGKAAMREYVTPIFAQASVDFQMTSEALEVNGDRAVEWGTCTGQMTLGGAQPVLVNLHYIYVYRRESSGRWRISHDISTPAPP